MNNKKGLMIIAVLLVAIIIGAAVLYNQLGSQLEPEAAIQEEKGASAPNFQVYDREGNPVELSQFIGKPIVLNFWASWCGPCKMEMPDFNELYLELGEDVHFLMVNCTDGSRETVEIASAFIAEQGYTFPVFFDTRGNAAYAYNANALPTTYFIDAEGYAISRATGAISADTLQKGIDMIYQP